MRLGEPLLPVNPESGYDRQLNKTLVDFFRKLTTKVNALAAGSFSGTDGVGTAAPTAGTFTVGDFIRNSAPSELGTAGSRYVIYGWLCVTSGTPGTWVQCRFLTGN